MASTVIKASGPQRWTEHVPYRFDDFGRQTESYLEQVRVQAAAIIAEAQATAANIRKQAEEAGRQKAIDAARKILEEKVGKQLESLLPSLREAIEGVRQARADWMRTWEQNAIGLATAIASRVVRREIGRQPEIPLNWIREALELAAGAPKLTLRLNAADHETLAASLPKLLAEFRRLAQTEVVADPNVTPGGCRLETEFGAIDQQIETQLTRIQEELSTG